MNKRLAILLTALMLVLLVVHLQHVQKYLFFFREQLMVFLYDPSIITDRYLGMAGPAQLLSHLLVQFFKLPYVGAVLTGLLGVLSATLLWKSLRRISLSVLLLPLAILPVIFICDGLFDVYYDYVGLVAYFLFTLVAHGCHHAPCPSALLDGRSRGIALCRLLAGHRTGGCSAQKLAARTAHSRHPHHWSHLCQDEPPRRLSLCVPKWSLL